MLTASIIIVFALVWALVLRHDVWMFQQNSYIASRFWTWFRSNPVSATFSLGLKKAKVPFVVTRRVVRILCASVLLGAAVIVAATLSFGTVGLIAAAVCVLLLDKLLVVAAGFVLSPVEAAIRRWYWNDARKRLESVQGLVVIGVTGSYGKTSTKNFLYRMLSEKYNTLVTPGNYNTTLGVIRTIREQLQPYHQVFIVEMGAKRPGDIREICELVHPRYGIVSAVGPMHLETFKTFENIQRTKFELVRSLPKDGAAFINADSEGIRTYSGISSDARIVRYGINAPEADWKVEGLRYSSGGSDFILSHDGESLAMHTALSGSGNILDICGAAAAAFELGVSPESIRIASAKLRQVEHRLSISRRGGITILDDAYNSNPEGAAMALDVLAGMDAPEGARRIVVTPGFVELGPRQYEECVKLGRKAAECADILIVVNRLNRKAIMEGAESMGERAEAVDSLSEAAARTAALSRPGDIILYENDLPDTFK